MDAKKEQILAAKVSICGWIVLFIVPLIAGIVTDSITLLLDASQGFVTLAISFLVRISLGKINKPPDDFYHFGYGKYEPMTIAMQGIMMILTCIICIKFAVQDIVHPEDITRYDIPIIAACISGIIGLAIAFYIRYIAVKTHSIVLRTSSFSWFIDCVLSFAIFAGFLFGFMLKKKGYNNVTPYVDPVMAIILALSFMVVPIKIVIENILELLDAAPPKHITDNIKKIVEQCKPGHFVVDSLKIRKAGEKIFLNLCFLTDENLTVREIRHSNYAFEKELLSKLPHCDILIHHKAIHEEKPAA